MRFDIFFNPLIFFTMKNSNLKSFVTHSLIGALFFFSLNVFSQNPPDKAMRLTSQEVIKTLDDLSLKNKAVKTIDIELRKKTYLPTAKAFGLKGVIDGKTAMILIRDFQYKANSKKTAAQLYIIQEKRSYNAMIEFTGDASLDQGYIEHFIDENGALQLTHSWSSCFRDKIRESCGRVLDVDKIWNKCKGNLSFNLSSFMNCVFIEGLKQAKSWRLCFFRVAIYSAWTCIGQ
jgi:hypothetical protein